MNAIIVFCANYLIVLVIIATAIAWLQVRKDNKVQVLAQIILAGGIAYILSKIASSLYFDTRPFVAQHITPLISHAPDNGFPSDHSTLAAAFTVVTFLFNRKFAYGMIIATILIGIARVMALIHSPLDVVAGWIIGTIAALTSFYLINWFANMVLGKSQVGHDEHLDKKTH